MALFSDLNVILFVAISVSLLLQHLAHTEFSEYDWNTVEVRVQIAGKRCPNVGGFNSQCRPASVCALWYDLVRITPGTACKLNTGLGICCPDLPLNNFKREPIKQANSRPNHKDLEGHVESRLNIASVNSVAAESSYSHLLLIVEKEAPRLLEAAIKAGQLQLSKMVETEQRLAKRHIVVVPGTDRALYALLFQTTDESQKISLGALRGISTSTELVKRLRIHPEQTEFALNRIVIRDTYFSDTCPADSICDEKAKKNPFRTPDGSCNNLRHSSWGKSRTQFQRLFVPVYADGVRQPRRALNGGELPSARLLSTSIAVTARSQGNDPNVKWSANEDTYWVTQYGQFLDHDITQTVQSKLTTRLGEIQCCMADGQHIDKDIIHPECLPIDIPQKDPFFSKLSPARRCMNFIRSAPARRSDCRLGYAEQMNDNTHLLDLSNVYGSDAKVTRGLRTHKKGSLNVTSQREIHSGSPVKHMGLDFLPYDEAEGTGISSCALSKGITGKDPSAHVKCFKAGDGRSSVTPNLAVTHTVFLRQHNRLVALLADLNPHWNDERLYQEARRILTAQMQHITYNEWLPVLIGREKMKELGLLPLLKGFSRDYNENVNPSILNEFAGAAFRFGHSLVQGQHYLYDLKRKKTGSVQLRHHFFKTQSLYTPGNLDKFLVGLATQPDQKVDNVFTEELTNHLFEEEGKGYGMDLVSLNIQRGRDHGLPGYNSYRALCGLPRLKDFDDLIDLIPQKTVDKLKSLYASVDDVDLFLAGVSERPAKGAVVGPTFQCIIADQFLRLKRGDRYFYDLGGQSGSFTEKQLEEIRKTSFARLICDNSLVQFTQPLIFKSVSNVNPIVDCKSTDSIFRVSLQAWKERAKSPERKNRKIGKTRSTLG